MFQEDYVLRQIEMIVMILARLLYGKNVSEYTIQDETAWTASDELYMRLYQMLEEGKINEAENLLYEEMDTGNMQDLKVALGFYSKLKGYDDAFLEAHDYSREEIKEGLENIAEQFGINLE